MLVQAQIYSGGQTPIPTDWRLILQAFPERLRDDWEERAAIIQYDGNEPRPTAERRAFECIVHQDAEAEAIVAAHCADVDELRARWVG